MKLLNGKNISIVLSLYVYISISIYTSYARILEFDGIASIETTQSWGVRHFVQDLCLDDSALCWHSN